MKKELLVTPEEAVNISINYIPVDLVENMKDIQKEYIFQTKNIISPDSEYFGLFLLSAAWTSGYIHGIRTEREKSKQK